MRSVQWFASYAAAVVLALPATCASSEVNALWNDKYGFGLWLYGAPHDCQGPSSYTAPFINVGPGGHHESFKEKVLDNAAISLCASFGPGSKVTGTCAVQRLELKFDKALNQFFGNYELSFSSGKKVQGPFRAAFCAPD
jgi:hypothetical protein